MAGPRPGGRPGVRAALDPPASGLVIGISHEGGTAATNRALEAARAAGARTAIITVSDRSPGAAIADIVVTTDELDQSWCHTIGYVAPLLAATAVAAALRGEGGGRGRDPRLMAAGAADTTSAEAMAATLAGSAPHHRHRVRARTGPRGAS